MDRMSLLLCCWLLTYSIVCAQKQPNIWSTDQGNSLPLQPLLFDGGSIVVVPTGEDIQSWRLSGAYDEHFNESALTTVTYCTGDIGCMVLHEAQVNDTHMMWHAYDTIGLINVVTGDFVYRIASTNHEYVTAWSVVPTADAVFTTFEQKSAGTQVCSYTISTGAKNWCVEACNECKLTIGDFDTTSGNLFISTNAPSIIALSGATGQVSWTVTLTSSDRSNGPVSTIAGVMFCNDKTFSLYDAATGSVLHSLTLSSRGELIGATETTAFVIGSSTLFTVSLTSWTQLGSTSLITSSVSSFVVASPYLVAASLDNSIVCYDLSSVTFKWQLNFTGSLQYFSQSNLVAVGDLAGSVYWIDPGTSNTVLECGTYEDSGTTTLPVYVASSDTWIWASTSNTVAQCIGQSVPLNVISLANSSQFAGIAFSEGQTQVVVTPGDANAGLGVIDVASWSWVVHNVIPDEQVKFAAFAAALEYPCGPGGASMLYLTMEQANELSPATGVFAFHKSTASLAWSVTVNTTQPAVLNCQLFVGDDQNNAYAYDAQTGVPIWHLWVNPENTENNQGFDNFPPAFGSLPNVYFLSVDSTLTAISIDAGKLVWSRILYAPLKKIYQPICAPIASGGKLYVVHPNNAMFYKIDEATGDIDFEYNIAATGCATMYDNKVYFVAGESNTYFGTAWYDMQLNQVLFMFVDNSDMVQNAPIIDNNGFMLLMNEAFFVVYLPERKVLWTYYVKGETLEGQFGTNGYVYGEFFGIQIFNQYTGQHVMTIPQGLTPTVLTVQPATPSNQVTMIVLDSSSVLKYSLLPLPQTTIATLPPGWTPFPAPPPPAPTPPDVPGGSSANGGPSGSGGPSPNGGYSNSGSSDSSGYLPNGHRKGWNRPYHVAQSTSFAGFPVTIAVLFILAFIVFSIVHKKRYRATGKPSEEMLLEILQIHSGNTV